MRDIIGVGELKRKITNGENIPILGSQRQEAYVRQARGEFINEFSGVGSERGRDMPGLEPPETLRSLNDLSALIHPGDTEFGGSQTGFEGLSRVGNVTRVANLPAEGNKPSQEARGAFGDVTLDLLGGLGSLPAEGNKPAKPAIPAFGALIQGVRDFFRPKETSQISGLGFGATATDPTGLIRLPTEQLVPEAGDTRGHTAANFIQILKGHKETPTTRLAQYKFDWMFAHGGDEFKIGDKDRPTSWVLAKEDNPQGILILRTPQRIDLAANEFKTIRNDEDRLSRTDINLYLKLLSVGPTAEETTDAAMKQARADKAIQYAQASIMSASSVGIDVTSMQKTIAGAQASYGANDYDAATSAANNAATAAIDAKALMDRQILERQKTDIQKDSTLNADQKANMLKDIDDQKQKVTDDASGQKSNLPKTPIPWVPIGIGVGIAAAIGIAFAVLRKK